MKPATKIPVFLIVFFMFSMIPSVLAQDDFQATVKPNNFTNTKWIKTQNNLIINTSINRVYLSKYNISGGGVYENFTLFTEYEEANNYITDINETHFRAKCDLQYGRYLVYDYGEDYFENFTIRFAVYINGIGNGGLNDHYMFSMNNQTLGDLSDFGYDDCLGLNLNDDTAERKRIRFYSAHNGETINSGFIVDNTLADDWLYIQIKKEGPEINCTVYDNEDYTGLHWSYNITHTNGSPNYRYLYPVNTYDQNLYPNYWLDVWVKNLDIGSGYDLVYFPSGNLYTVNLLENSTDINTYSVFYGYSDEDETSLECFISLDNSTWNLINNCGEILTETYNETLYLWFRLNTTDNNKTPFLDYYHVILSGSVDGLVFGDLNWMVLVIWMLLLCLGYVTEKVELKAIGSVTGIIFALMLLSEAPLIAYLVFVLNILIFLWELGSKK